MKSLNKISSIFTLCLLALLFMGQDEIHPVQEHAEDEVTITEKVANLSIIEKEAYYARLEELINERLAQCRESGAIQAARYVDSLIIEEALQNRRLEYLIPPKPGKPGNSGLDFNLDSLKIAPLIKDTIN
jgi:hypothetical protein